MTKQEQDKQAELKTLTWKYFWRYKLIELIIVGIIALVIWICYINRVVIEKWLSDNHPVLMSFLGWFIIVMIVIAIIFFIIISNWSKAEEKAKEKLGIESVGY